MFTASMMKVFTRDQITQADPQDSLLCIIDSQVSDLTDFVDAHPGGETVLRQVAGQDATAEFYNVHRHEVLRKYSSLQVGRIEGEESQVVQRQPGDISP